MPSALVSELLGEQLELADALRAGRNAMSEPQDLPGRYGRAIRAIDRLLAATGCPAVVAGGWAVWRHGYVGRVTQDVDVVVPADMLSELLRTAAVSGFEVLPAVAGCWPKLCHKESGISVDLLPEGQRPGTASHPAPTTIPHPARLGARGTQLVYADLKGLIELKLAAGRARDDSDIVELLRANPDQVDTVRAHLAQVNDAYVTRLATLLSRAQEETDR